MKRFVPLLFAAGAFVLASCGGGTGTPPTSGGGPSPAPTNTPAQTPTTTNAWGVVVDDANGAPLPGVKVALMPWAPCGPTPSPATTITPQNDGCPTPLPSPRATTDANGNFTLNGVANGHYLLVIGNDVSYTPPPGYAPPACTTNCGTPSPAPFVVQAVVHDNVTLTGGNQMLKAPTLPDDGDYAAPTWETNGDYRLTTLDAQTEMPCYISWESLRTQYGLAGTSVDEWLTENVRAINYDIQEKQGTYPPIVPNGDGVAAIIGGGACQDFIDPSTFSGNAHATDPRTIWFAGQYLYYDPAKPTFSAFGVAEFPADPRSSTITWP